MGSRILAVVLTVGILFAGMGLVQSVTTYVQMPGSNKGYEPEQPIAYSHRLHAGELGMQCQYCHFGAEQSRSAGVPPVNVCMNCHTSITAPYNVVRHEDRLAQEEKRKPRPIVSPELQKLLRHADAAATTNLEWVRIHRLPDFVYFNHSAHVNAQVACQTCHGEVQTMERVRQVEDLSMGWCVNCHRDYKTKSVGKRRLSPPTDCVGCHY